MNYNDISISNTIHLASTPYMTDEQKARYEQYDIEQAWPNVRSKRNVLLKQCDWVMLEGVPISDEKKQEWVEYRKALRDIPQNFETIESIIWPRTPK